MYRKKLLNVYRKVIDNVLFVIYFKIIKIDKYKSGLLQTAFILSYMVFAPLFGYLGDRYNRKVIMSSGVFLWCLTTFVGSYMKVDKSS